MRQIVLDTETTGLSPTQGHRIIEIGCLELIDRRLTGRDFHVYLNPDREVEDGAFRVHGISSEFLQDKPRFKDVVDDFLAFVKGAELIIHNAPFDVGFLNAELKHLKLKTTLEAHCEIFDTLTFAREKHPGQRNNLDALCKRYDVNNNNRALHGALLDAELLAFVYLAMTGGQTNLFIEETQEYHLTENRDKSLQPMALETPVILATEEELVLHETFVEFLAKKSGVHRFLRPEHTQ